MNVRRGRGTSKKEIRTFKGKFRRYLMVPDRRVSGHNKGLHKRHNFLFGSTMMLVFQTAIGFLFWDYTTALLGVSRNHR
jgi:hypothetical protein